MVNMTGVKLQVTGCRNTKWAWVLVLLSPITCSLSPVLAQQPQAQAGQAIFPVNAKYVQGFGPGYWPTAGSNLTLNLAPGTAVCSNTVQTYAGGTLSLAPSATNYVYLDPAHNCAPASNTTGFATATIPIARVVTTSTAISSVADVRTLFVSNGVTSPGTVTSVGMAGDGIIFNPTVAGSPVTASGTLAPQLLTQTPNTVLAGPGSGPSATPTFRSLAPADMPATISSSTTGNAATASALAATPTQCTGTGLSQGITSNGNANCIGSQPANTFYAAPGGASGNPSFRPMVATDLPASISSNTSGNAATATALASGPTQCGSSNWATGVSTNGNANCLQPGFSNLAGSVAIGQTPLTTGGDLLFVNSTPALARLPIGGTNQFLGISGGLPVWIQPTFSNLSGNATVSQGGTGQTTAAAAFNALSPLTTEGDLHYYHSSSNTRLAVGGANTFLTSNGTDPSWGSLTGAGFGNQTANNVLVAPNGSNGNPSFRTLVAGDLPASITSNTSGNAGTATALATAPGQCAGSAFATGIATSGNANCIGSQTANTFYAAPSGSSGAPAFRALLSSDLPTIAIAGGGTGQTTATAAFNALSPLTTEGDLHYYHTNSNTRLGIGGNGQCLTSNGADPVWGSCGSSAVWSSLANPTANLTLSMSNYTTTFNHTSGANWTWANTTAATSGTSQSSPIQNLAGTYWTGAASATDSWSFQDVIASGTNGNSTLTLAHAGSSGTATLNVPNLTDTATTQYGVMYGGGSSATVKSTAAGASGIPLLGQGSGSAPAFGTLGIAGGGTGQTTASAGFNSLSPLTTEGDLLYYHTSANARLARGSNGQCLTSNGTDPVWGSCSTGSGTVTSVGMSMPSMFSVSGSPVTGSGTLTATLANQNANLIMAGPTSGNAAVPTFRALVGTDLPVPTASTLGGVESVACTSGQFMNQITTGGVPGCAAPSASGNPSGLGNGATVIDATLQSGADFGVQMSNALAQASAAGGGTVDGRGFVCPTNCHIGTANLAIGDGVHPVTVYLPVGTITRDPIGGTGPSAQILYNSNVTVYGYGTTISGATDTAAVQQAFSSSGVSNSHLYGFTVSDTGPVAPDSVALQLGGPNSGIPLVAPPSTLLPTTIASLGGGYFFPGALAHVAIYPKALSASRIAAHYAAASTVTGYESAVEADSPSSYYPLNEASGTTTNDLVGSRNGTYTGGVTLNTQAWVAAGSKAASFDGTSGFVQLPSYNWFNGGDYTIEFWGYRTGDMGFNGIFSSSNGSNGLSVTDSPSNGNFYVYRITNGANVPPYLAPNAGYDLPLNTWAYVAITYTGGNITFYVNAAQSRAGTDTDQSTFQDLQTSGADIGIKIDGQHGCWCYNQLNNVSAAGASVGAKITNSSGYAFGVNSDQWNGGRISGPIGLWDSGTDKVSYSYLDFENNQSSTGAILYTGPDGNNAGLGYVVGDTVRPAGGDSTAVFTVTGIGTGGYVAALTVTTPGTTYSNAQSVATTTLTGIGSGLRVDLIVSAANLLLSNGGSMILNPYEENSAPDYICSSGNFISGAFAGASGASYSATKCTGPSSQYGGPASNFFWGPGLLSDSIGLSNGGYITAGGTYDSNIDVAFRPSASFNVNLFPYDGPAFGGRTSQIYGMWGHADWNVGVSRPHAGTLATGRSTFSQIANPGAPTLTAYGGTGTTSSPYGLVCNDGNGGTTLPAAPVTTVSGPSVLGALYILTVSNGGSGYVSGDVGTHFTVIQGSNTSGQGTITSVSGGAVTGVSIYVAGSQYATSPYPGSGGTNIFATSGGSGTGLTVAATATSITITYPLTDGCRSWTVLKGDTLHAVPGGQSTNSSANLIDFGDATVGYTPSSRNTTADTLFAGVLQTANNTLDDGYGNLTAANKSTAQQFCISSNCISSLWSNPMTTPGDILFEGASGVAMRLAGNTSSTPMYLKSIGLSGVATAPTLAQIQFSDIAGTLGVAAGGTGQTSFSAGLLRSNGTVLSSSELSGDCTTSGANAVACTMTNGVSFASSATTDTTNAANITSGIFTSAREPSTTVNSISNDTNVTGTIAAQNLTLGWTGQLSIVRGGTGQTTASAAFNSLSPLSTEGDLNYFHSSSNTRLAIGGANTFLTSNGTDPSWSSLTGAGFGSQAANTMLAGPSGASGNPAFRSLVAADIPSSITSNTSGNASTATALAAVPTQCSGNNFATGVAASGNANCSQPTFANLSGLLALSQTPLTTTGDLLYVNSTPGLARLPIGIANQFLGISGGSPGWIQPSFGTLSGSVSIAQLPTVPVANGGTGQTTASAGFNALSPLSTEGDLLYYHSSANTRLAVGSNGQCLTSNGTDPAWASCSGTGGTSAWNSLTAPTTNLSISMGSYTSAFNATTAVNNYFTWANTTAATSSAAQSSPLLGLCGQGWEGSTPANTSDCWQMQNSIGNGSNPAVTLALTNTGSSSGSVQVQVPNLNATSSVSTGTPPSCTVGSAGALCLGEGTAATAASGVDQIYADSTHNLMASLNGVSFSSGATFAPIAVMAISTQTGTYSALSTDFSILCNSTSAFTITLPTTGIPTGKVYRIKNINTGACTVSAGGSVNIDGATTYVLATQWGSIDVQWNGTQYYIF